MSLSFDFYGRTALVTGGSQGIGEAIAVALAAAGARVHVFDVKAGTRDGLAYHVVDIRSREAISEAVAGLDAPVTLLVNNAGITRDRTLAKMSDREWREVLDVNLAGAFNMLSAVVPGMVAAGGGRIVNITSINGLRGKFGQANYAAAKAGLIGLTKTAARELGAKGITVNAVAPGMVMTEMARALPERYREAALAEAVLPALAEPADIAHAVMFLMSDAAGKITGEVLKVDAGQYL